MSTASKQERMRLLEKIVKESGKDLPSMERVTGFFRDHYLPRSEIVDGRFVENKEGDFGYRDSFFISEGENALFQISTLFHPNPLDIMLGMSTADFKKRVDHADRSIAQKPIRYSLYPFFSIARIKAEFFGISFFEYHESQFPQADGQTKKIGTKAYLLAAKGIEEGYLRIVQPHRDLLRVGLGHGNYYIEPTHKIIPASFPSQGK